MRDPVPTLRQAGNLTVRRPAPFAGEVPYLATADVAGSVVAPSESYSFLGRPSRADLILKAGDVLQAKMAETDKAVLVGDEMSGWLASTGFAQFSPDPNKTDPQFLFQWLRSDQFFRAKEALCVGSTQRAVNQTDLGRIPVDFPAVGTQRCIADILAAADEAIEQTEALIAKTQQIKAGLMHDLFTRGVLPDGHPRPPPEQAPELYKESPVGWIPAEWDSELLGALTSKIVDGVHHTPTYVEAGIPFVTVKNLTASRTIDFADLNYVAPQDHRIFLQRADPKPDDVLVTKDGTLGVSRIVEPWHPEFSIFVSVALLRPLPQAVRSSTIHLFFDSGLYERQLGKLSAGTGLKHIHLEHFRRFVIPLPSIEEQDRIWDFAKSTETVLDDELQQVSTLRSIRSGLMHDLLTGRVRAPSNHASSTATPPHHHAASAEPAVA